MLDGHVNKCKTCNKKDNTKNRKDKLEYYTAYDKQRAMLPHRVEKRKEYAQSENGKKIINNLHRKWVERNPEQAKANWSVSNAIRDGKIAIGNCNIRVDKATAVKAARDEMKAAASKSAELIKKL